MGSQLQALRHVLKEVGGVKDTPENRQKIHGAIQAVLRTRREPSDWEVYNQGLAAKLPDTVLVAASTNKGDFPVAPCRNFGVVYRARTFSACQPLGPFTTSN